MRGRKRRIEKGSVVFRGGPVCSCDGLDGYATGGGVVYGPDDDDGSGSVIVVVELWSAYFKIPSTSQSPIYPVFSFFGILLFFFCCERRDETGSVV